MQVSGLTVWLRCFPPTSLTTIYLACRICLWATRCLKPFAAKQQPGSRRAVCSLESIGLHGVVSTHKAITTPQTEVWVVLLQRLVFLDTCRLCTGIWQPSLNRFMLVQMTCARFIPISQLWKAMNAAIALPNCLLCQGLCQGLYHFWPQPWHRPTD